MSSSRRWHGRGAAARPTLFDLLNFRQLGSTFLSPRSNTASSRVSTLRIISRDAASSVLSAPLIQTPVRINSD